MQTILGGGGPIGLELARILPDYTERVRIVGRNPEKVIPENEVFVANLLDSGEVRDAVAGSDVAYLSVGLPYKASVWEAQWPKVMRNTIEACRASGSKLVFFDNIYMYDREHLSPMDENTAVRPTTRKGAVRAMIADMLMEAVQKDQVDALIARCADFYGPGRQKHSVLTQTVFERLASGKSAQWLLSVDHVHSFTYTPDASLATAMLGNTDDAYGQVWHLPTTEKPPTGREWIEMIAEELEAKPRVQVASNFMMSAVGLFSPTLREVKEMAYQYDRDYDFRSDKFNRRFDFTPTTYRQGIKAVVAADYG
ncbi:MAG TPA: NAD-dependent epimerase/dehydratase family protein [Woeseiaceae bacterium]